MSSHRWTQGLSKLQLEEIYKDTKNRERQTGQSQSHVYADIDKELIRRKAKAGAQ